MAAFLVAANLPRFKHQVVLVIINNRVFFHSFSTVLDDQQNVRPIKELLQTLYLSLCGLVQDMGKSVLVGNINIWVHRMENIMQWQQQLDNIQINRVRTRYRRHWRGALRC